MIKFDQIWSKLIKFDQIWYYLSTIWPNFIPRSRVCKSWRSRYFHIYILVMFFLKTLLKCKEKYWSLVFCHANCLPRNLKSKLVYWEIYQNSFKYLRLNILIFLPPAGTELILEMISHWFITRSRSSCEDWSRVTQTLTALQVTLKYILLSW